ncbi:MAG TPA: hypothetical protein VHA52_10735, partial [Candidatus Babeliaceae bacterium]|nr:hypothetical protein [Candidatus Babeliaceae bacterium]
MAIHQTTKNVPVIRTFHEIKNSTQPKLNAIDLKATLMKMNRTFTLVISFLLFSSHSFCQQLQINDSGYFEKRGLNVFVFSNQYNGMFFDEKTAGIEIIHHGVRTSTGGAVRLQNTPEQWDLIPTVVSRKVDKKNNSIDVVL